jgi:uroporphyrinogen-III synthase
MKTVLIIKEDDEFSRILATSGFEVINLPLIETKILEDLSGFDEKLAEIENYDGVFITSAKAAHIFAEKSSEKKADFGGSVYVLGKRSYQILKTENLDLVYFESANTAREMLRKIAPEDLKGRRFLFVRGAKSLRVIPDFLAENATVDEVIVYETMNVKVETSELIFLCDKFKRNEIVCACFFSPSAAESFIEQFGRHILHLTEIAAIGKTTAKFIERQNLKVNFVSAKASAEDFAEELISYLRK